MTIADAYAMRFVSTWGSRLVRSMWRHSVASLGKN